MAFSQADLNAIAAAQAAHPALPPGYLTGVAQIETGGSANPDTAASGTGPVGLFQVAPSTYINPGFGLPNQNLTYAQAQAALQDPATNANFAASYLDALQSNKGSIDAATQFYSGGGYGQSQVLAAESQFPGTVNGSVGTGDEISPNTANDPNGIFGGASSQQPEGPGAAMINGANAVASGLITPVWELLTRGGVFILGMMLLFIALLAMLWQSKTVQVSVKSLAATA